LISFTPGGDLPIAKDHPSDESPYQQETQSKGSGYQWERHGTAPRRGE
jgi:hypothetical protein